jgi:hypothetical protein
MSLGPETGEIVESGGGVAHPEPTPRSAARPNATPRSTGTAKRWLAR